MILKEDTEGRWFDHDEEGVRFKLKYEPDMNACDSDFELLDKVLEDWEGIDDEKGNSLECNRINKASFMRSSFAMNGGYLWIAAKVLSFNNYLATADQKKTLAKRSNGKQVSHKQVETVVSSV